VESSAIGSYLADGLPFPDEKTILFWFPGAGPYILLRNGQFWALSGVPYPTASSPLVPISLVFQADVVDYWDFWVFWQQHPEFWLYWGNYDP
jgi:hypothetical protein